MKLITAPVSLGDLVFPSALAKATIDAFVACTFDWLILAGPPGTGKSMAAKIAMAARINGLDEKLDLIALNASIRNGVDDLRSAFVGLSCVGQNAACIRCLIVEEVDRFSSAAAKEIKGHLDKVESWQDGTPIIFTTNHPNQLDRALVSRAQLVNWSALSPLALQQRALQVLANNGKTMPVEEIDRLIVMANGDLRHFMRNLAIAA
jgi:replication-associated recombination protein RarA